jgi:hypothetical protein
MPEGRIRMTSGVAGVLVGPAVGGMVALGSGGAVASPGVGTPAEQAVSRRRIRNKKVKRARTVFLQVA